MSDRRIHIDITMAARIGGQADGIIRVMRELARYGSSRTDTDLVVLDAAAESFHVIDASWSSDLVEGNVVVDLPHFSVDARKRKRRSRVRQWISHPRREAFTALERLRLTTGWIGRASERLQFHLMNKTYRKDFIEPGGGRRRFISLSEASSRRLGFAEDDVLVLCGSDWPAMYHFLKTRDRATAGHVVVLCHDIIPILFPQYFLPETAQQFALCFNEVFRVADLVVFTSEAVRRDALIYCKSKQLSLENTRVVPLGSIASKFDDAPAAELPAGLQKDRYVLFVSTMEPRKGHEMLLSVWKRLLEEPSCREAKFNLVFVGRKGWLVDDLLARFDKEPCVGVSLHILTNIDDRTLAQLYANAAFCVYPSIYEGFGLPIVESFRHGKAVIASTGGAIPEVVGGMSPCLDPRDENLWFETMLAWIENPELRKPYEQAIRARRERSWSEMGKEFFSAIEDVCWSGRGQG